jgi:hypothetical protein
VADPGPDDPLRRPYKTTRLNVDPKVAAASLAKMREGLRRWHKDRKGAVIDASKDMLDVTNLRGFNRRHLEVCMMYLAGLPYEVIREVLCYTARSAIVKVLRRPECAKLIDDVRREQLNHVIRGEFGVRAAAKAAAPMIIKRVIEKAGGNEGPDGKPVGMAAKDADALRAADLSLTISGDKVERSEQLHTHVLLGQMTPEELRAYADHGVWPKRLEHIGRQIEQRRGLPSPSAG